MVRVLSETDVLVTDYSSVYLDFLLTGRPIVFLPYDLDQYLLVERSLYFDYMRDDVTPGPKCQDWASCIDAMTALVEGHDDYSRARSVATSRFHHFNDDRSSDRALTVALDLAEVS